MERGLLEGKHLAIQPVVADLQIEVGEVADGDFQEMQLALPDRKSVV